MAANAPPDPKSLSSWEDAFKYPIPVVRRMEQQLRIDITQNREKLRSLVGASYRDLLGTAERIVEMDQQMKSVESNLGAIGQKCNSRAVDRIARNFSRFETGRRELDRPRYAFASQLAILQGCPLVISRILRNGGSLLLAAKVLVISRLLHKTLSQTAEDNPTPPPIVDTLRRQLASLRRVLIRQVDDQFSDPALSTNSLVEAMCAFSLATSSSTADVSRHFYHARTEAMLAQLERHAHEKGNVLALKLYLRTLQDSKSILPKRLADALQKLKSQPLIECEDVRTRPELNLNVHERWIEDGIKIFTPWTKHDDLSNTESRKFLKDWAQRALRTLLNGLEAVLTKFEDFTVLVRLRKDMLETWFDPKNKVAGFTSSEALDELRNTMNKQLLHLVRVRSSRLKLVGGEIAATLQDWESGVTDLREDLWNVSTTSMDISDGAQAFKQAILDRSHGRNNAVLRVTNSYETWLRFIEEVSSVIKHLQEHKWDEDLENEEDENALDTRNAQLSQDDPRLLQEELDQSLSTAFRNLNAQARSLSQKFTSKDRGMQSAFMLRILREIRDRPPKCGEIASFALDIIPELHKGLAEVVIAQPVQRYSRTLSKGSQLVSTRALWEGIPPLPVQPSPNAFRLLQKLAKTMSEYGADLWSSSATAILKDCIQHRLKALLENALALDLNRPATIESPGKSDDSEGVDGSSDKEERGMDEEEERMYSLLFDLLYLQYALKSPLSPGVGFTAIETSLVEFLKLSDSSRERLRKNAKEYWKRTSLLFALLV
ncbi:MAG: hypothetical protein M1829_004413 [Trizodia sp. TS-e1964]|nr:MAG: hypothetical protein M1829_004413 [Trizodia sp. TS-e1964]